MSHNHNGYRRVGNKLEHRVLMEEHLGRALLPNEAVHHINGIKDDNRLENLVVLTRGEHIRLHKTGKRPKNGWSFKYERCTKCGTTETRHFGHGLCQTCYSRIYQRKHSPKTYEWAFHYPCCTECGTTTVEHKAKGLCLNCYQRTHNHKDGSWYQRHLARPS